VRRWIALSAIALPLRRTADIYGSGKGETMLA
jgi:hypothetical protein